MPRYLRTVQYFGCDFKCGHRADYKFKIELHEEKCYCNPKNKACRICKNCSFFSNTMICEAKKLEYPTRGNPSQKVYKEGGDELIWEWQELSDEEMLGFNTEKIIEVFEHNQNRPFPTKNCELFILSKKVY